MLPIRYFIRHFKHLSRPNIKICRNFGTYEKEYEVPQYCTLNVKCPYNVRIKPLDQLVYLDNDRLKIKVNSSNVNIKCEINYNDIHIKDDIKHVPEDYVCDIELPMKANLYVDTERNITIGDFHSEVINLKSDRGDITVEKAHSDRVVLVSNRGNITCKGLVHAKDITLMTARSGAISTGRLQGINLKIETENGDVKVQSSYCDNSVFETQRGKLDLQNTHKNNQIFIHNEGNLTIFGLDGKIEAFVNKGNIDIQISRILENSSITLNEGKVALKLSDSVQDDTMLEVLAKYFVIEKNISLTLQRIEDKYLMLPTKYDEEKMCKKLVVDCKNSNVTLETANWSEIFKIAMQSKK